MAPSALQHMLRLSVEELRSVSLWKALGAEFVGTFILVFAGCAVCLDNWQQEAASRQSTTVQISLTFGLAVATAVWCVAHVSGGHINPAVTAAMLLTRKLSALRAALYVLVQCLAAVVGAGLLCVLHPSDHHGDTLGNTLVQFPVTLAQACGLEAVITFILVLTVFASCDKGRTDLGGSIPLTIGLSVALCHFFAIKYTGSSMNPARSFGPAVISGCWKDHWVYWVGPILGGLVASLLYELVFAVDASLAKVKALLAPAGHVTEMTPAVPLNDRNANEGGEIDRHKSDCV